MKYIFLKDMRRRMLFDSFEKRKVFLKSLVEDLRLSKSLRVYAYKELLQLPKDSSLTRIRNRCVLTNRPRAVYKKFGLSRLMFRKYV
ncbi:MAG: 30S ribosomal protein S14 [Flavobacterium sp.]|jgi:ribosomal protein S14|nr:MAG: 30S ribosomal protein S14 [Flavobacterium sp.]